LLIFLIVFGGTCIVAWAGYMGAAAFFNKWPFNPPGKPKPPRDNPLEDVLNGEANPEPR
ncbi:hypothetical protein BaRGS_00023214, partial [Batillaria attramentaria]